MGDQIIESLCRTGSPKENMFPLFNLKMFSKNKKNTAK